MAHFDPDGLVAPHVRRQVLAWSRAGVRLIVVTTAQLQAADRSWLTGYAELIERENAGYDFLSYQQGLAAAGDLSGYVEVVICNDSYVGPLRPYAEIFEQMSGRKADFWGIARSDRQRKHVQSYFVVFRRTLLDSPQFAEFWAEVVPLASRRQVIRRYEIGMSTRFRKAGFRQASYFVETPRERRRGRLRVIWWVLHRRPKAGEGSRLARLWRDFHEPWNPTYGLADSALREARLPLVKIDTLRNDPYGLNAARLLELCEQTYPAEFDGVRAFLERTASRYPTRAGEDLRPTPLWLRPFAPLVAYRR